MGSLQTKVAKDGNLGANGHGDIIPHWQETFRLEALAGSLSCHVVNFFY